VPLKVQKLLTLPEHLSSLWFLGRVRVVQSAVLCLVLSRSLYVFCLIHSFICHSDYPFDVFKLFFLFFLSRSNRKSVFLFLLFLVFCIMFDIILLCITFCNACISFCIFVCFCCIFWICLVFIYPFLHVVDI
jgi:hypothetical protein